MIKSVCISTWMVLSTFLTHSQTKRDVFLGEKVDTLRLNRIAMKLSKDEQSLRKIARRIKDSCTTDLDKVYTVYTYIAGTYTYDLNRMKQLRKGKIKRDLYLSELLSKNKGICGDFSNLLSALCDSLNIPCFRVSGYAKTYAVFHPVRQKIYNHAWNVVRINGHWQTIDVTWGIRQFSNKRFNRPRINYDFLFMNPEQFGRTHLPADPTFQLVQPQRSYHSFRYHHFRAEKKPYAASVAYETVLNERVLKNWKDQVLEEALAAATFNPNVKKAFLKIMYFPAGKVVDKKGDRKGPLKRFHYDEAIYLYEGLKAYAEAHPGRQNKRCVRFANYQLAQLEKEKEKLKK